MPGPLNHSQADIVAQLLIDIGAGADPLSDDEWPVYVSAEPDSPDNTITVYDTDGIGHGRVHVSGERQEHHGVQVRVRSGTHVNGYLKARALARVLDEDVYQNSVNLGASSYLIHSFTRTTDVLSIGLEKPESHRRIFTVNFLVSLRTS